MPYGETKVYFDGSHYIAIPHTIRPNLRRTKTPEETITIVESEEGVEILKVDAPSFSQNNDIENCDKIIAKIDKNDEKTVKNTEKSEKIIKKVSKKEIFEQLYKKYIDLKKNERKKKILEEMRVYFEDDDSCFRFVMNNFERKQRNLICRRIRMARKANLANFNYFCTFTYDSNKHTEESFKKKLRTCFRHLCERKGWRYMGVWERAPETNRLHFHGLFHIPKNSLSGGIIKVRDYDTRSHRMRTTFQSEFFNKRFGRSDFEPIDENERLLGNTLAYLMKYIEKTGEKIVYSKGLPQYFISDIMDDDIICRIGQEDKKLLLFDDFKCWDEGVYMGKVSPEVIEQMRKSN